MSDAIDDQVVKTRGLTKEYAQQYQLNGSLTGEETPPQRLASCLLHFYFNQKNTTNI